MDNQRLRLILLLVFSFSLVMLWDAWQKYSQPKAVVPTVTGATQTATPPPTPSPGAGAARRCCADCGGRA